MSQTIETIQGAPRAEEGPRALDAWLFYDFRAEVDDPEISGLPAQDAATPLLAATTRNA